MSGYWDGNSNTNAMACGQKDPKTRAGSKGQYQKIYIIFFSFMQVKIDPSPIRTKSVIRRKKSPKIMMMIMMMMTKIAKKIAKKNRKNSPELEEKHRKNSPTIAKIAQK